MFNKNKNKKSLFTTVGSFITCVKISAIAIAMVALVVSCGVGESTYNPPPPGSTLIKNLGIDDMGTSSFTVGLDTIDPVEYPDAAYRLIVMSNNGDFATGRYSTTPTIRDGRVQLSVTDAATIGDGQVYQATVEVVSQLDTNTVYEASAPFAVITGAVGAVSAAGSVVLVPVNVTNDGQTLEFELTPGTYQAFYAVAGPDANNLLGEIPGSINRYFTLPSASDLLKDGVDSDVVVISNSGTAIHTVRFTGILIGYEYNVVVKPVIPRYIVNAKMVDGNGVKRTFGAAIKEAISSGANLARNDIMGTGGDIARSMHGYYRTRNTDGSIGDIKLEQKDLKFSSSNVFFSFNHVVGATAYRYIITNTTPDPDVRVTDRTVARSGAYAGYKYGGPPLPANGDYILTVIALNTLSGQTKRKQFTFKLAASGLVNVIPLVIKNENVAPVKPGVIKFSFAKQDNAAITAYNIYYKPHDANPNNFPIYPQKIITFSENPTNEFRVPGSVLGLPYDVKVEVFSGDDRVSTRSILTDAIKSYTAPEIRNMSFRALEFNPNTFALDLVGTVFKDYGSSPADGLKLYTRGRGITWDGTQHTAANIARGVRAYIDYNRPGSTTVINNGGPVLNYLINADNSDSAVELASVQSAIGKSFNVTLVITNVNSGLVTKKTRTFTHGSLIYPPLNTDITVIPGDKQLDISWKNVDSKGSAIAGYIVSVTNLGGPGKNVTNLTSANSGRVTVTGLMNATKYSVFILPFDTQGLNVVQAGFMTSPMLDFQNPATDGPKLGRYTYLNAIPVSPSSTAPGPVTGLTLAAGSDPFTSIVVSWTAPTSDGTTDGSARATITGYRVGYSAADGTVFAPLPVAAGATTANIPNLRPGTTYTVVVYADNSAGRSSQASKTINTATSQATAPGQPGTLTFPAANVRGTSMDVSWLASTDFGKKHDGSAYADGDVTYNVAVTINGVAVTGASVATPTGTTRKTATITGLTPGTAYTVTVTPSNPNGGPGTARTGTQTTSTATAPTQPGTLIFSSTTTSITAIWAVSTDPGRKADGTAYGAGDVVYTVTVLRGSTAVSTGIGNVSSPTTRTRRSVITGLTPNTVYTITVTPSNPDGGNGTARTGTQNTPSAATAPTVAPTSLFFPIIHANGFTARWNNITTGLGTKHDGMPYAATDITYDVAVTLGGSAVTTAVIGPVTSPSSTLRASVINGLSPFVTYTVTVTPRNADGGPGGSGTVLTGTQRTASAARAPSTPASITLTSASTTSITADWPISTDSGRRNDGTAYGAGDVTYTVSVVVTSTGVAVSTGIGGVTSPTAGTRQSVINGLTTGTQYTVSVVASNPTGLSAAAVTGNRTP